MLLWSTLKPSILKFKWMTGVLETSTIWCVRHRGRHNLLWEAMDQIRGQTGGIGWPQDTCQKTSTLEMPEQVAKEVAAQVEAAAAAGREDRAILCCGSGQVRCRPSPYV